MGPAPEDTALWRQIADQLRSDIAGEVYPAGSPLPGETLMADRYNTSRPTVRRAIAELAGEGLLIAAHGRGTFVRPRPDRRTILITPGDHHDLFNEHHYNPQLTGWTPGQHPDAVHYRAQGLNVTDTLITGATRDQAETLGIDTGQSILYRFTHWRHQHTHRVISVTSITPAHLLGFPDPHAGDDIPDEDDPRLIINPPHHNPPDDYDEPQPGDYPDPDPNAPAPELYTLLAKYGSPTFTTTVTARMPRGDELQDLGMDSGTPLLQITRTTTDPHGRALEATIIEAPSDRFEATTTPSTTRRPILTI